ncbi:methyltransferase domain-containing protein [Jatrophihabitans telluris]|uniref:Methyltransferase domain-containing protein n=1 Tax=Jatrophihabitans telluris TaxID=2038343 RepID=A0ABY4R230_9ACTN|nr:methyltransferase domain-containing protein [Jatrophihabitans telluris]UQX89527.1 methyltransferase domain-containing protein [Jatrophihabitans telluris]
MSDDARWAGSMPEIYDRCLGPTLFAPFAEHLAGIAAALAPTDVLELAAGTGIATAALAKAMPQAHLVATDLNPAMVEYGGARVGNARWQVADAQQLPQDDASFDLVMCQFGAMFFPDKPAAYAEAARVLRPGGTLLLGLWDAVAASEFAQAVVDGLVSVLPGTDANFVTRIPHGYHDDEQISADLQAGGLVDVQIDRVVLSGTAESAAKLAEGFCLGSPLRYELEAHGDPHALTQKIGAVMTTRLGSGPVQGRMGALTVQARRPL